ARSRGGEAHGGSGGGDVSRSDRRDRTEGRAVQRTAASVHAHADVGDSAAGSASAWFATVAGRRRAKPNESAVGVPVPYTLSVRDRALPRGNAGVAEVERGALHGVSSRCRVAAGGRGDRSRTRCTNGGKAVGAVRKAPGGGWCDCWVAKGASPQRSEGHVA